MVFNANIRLQKQAVDTARGLSSKTHKSFQHKNRIRRECVKISKDQSSDVVIQYCKIIAPVETRWNSTLMCIKSILQLRPALEAIKADRPQKTDKSVGSDPKLQAAIPEPEEFDIMEAIVGPLEKIAQV